MTQTTQYDVLRTEFKGITIITHNERTSFSEPEVSYYQQKEHRNGRACAYVYIFITENPSGVAVVLCKDDFDPDDPDCILKVFYYDIKEGWNPKSTPYIKHQAELIYFYFNWHVSDRPEYQSGGQFDLFRQLMDHQEGLAQDWPDMHFDHNTGLRCSSDKFKRIASANQVFEYYRNCEKLYNDITFGGSGAYSINPTKIYE